MFVDGKMSSTLVLKTFLDAELTALQRLSTSPFTQSTQINLILIEAKHKIQRALVEQVNNSLAIACLLSYCISSLPPTQAKAWINDALCALTVKA
jgi:hypothetical protein